MALFTLIFGILICFGIPIGGVLLLGRSKTGLAAPFFSGVLAFTVSQLAIRIPILTYVLPGFAWFTVLQMNPLLYGLFLAGTAALFEEGARWIAMKLLKEREVCNGLAFGLGHGGMEAMALVGLGYAVILYQCITGKQAWLSIDAPAVLIGSLERLFTITFHVGASLIVMHGLRTGKSGRYLLAAILLHTLVDMGPPAAYFLGLGSVAVEAYAAVIGLIALAFGLSCYLRKKEAFTSKNKV